MRNETPLAAIPRARRDERSVTVDAAYAPANSRPAKARPIGYLLLTRRSSIIAPSSRSNHFFFSA